MSCACFSIVQSFFNGIKHTIHQIEAGYHGFQMVSTVIWLSEN